MKKILIIVNSDWFFLMHIFPIIKSLNNNIEIHVLTMNSGKKNEIISHGFKFINLNIDRKGANPFIEFKTILNIYKVCKEIKPDIIHNITIKPIVYGSIISRLLKIKTINTVCGLGFSFIGSKKSFKYFFAFLGYKIALRNPNSFNFFENKEDLFFFRNKGLLLSNEKNKVVNGVGINLNRYQPFEKANNRGDKIIVLLASRMLWEKGIKEFVEASEILKTRFEGVIEFKIYGKIDKGNPGAISEEYLESIYVENYIKWHGFNSDMISVFRNSDIVALPSYYREGCPMVLMEACAMGKPIITTDMPGCKECVIDGENGFLISTKSSQSLANAVEKIIALKENIKNFEKASRTLAETKFDQSEVIKKYKKVFFSML